MKPFSFDFTACCVVFDAIVKNEDYPGYYDDRLKHILIYFKFFDSPILLINVKLWRAFSI